MVVAGSIHNRMQEFRADEEYLSGHAKEVKGGQWHVKIFDRREKMPKVIEDVVVPYKTDALTILTELIKKNSEYEKLTK